jgi:hypothetical protein
MITTHSARLLCLSVGLFLAGCGDKPANETAPQSPAATAPVKSDAMAGLPAGHPPVPESQLPAGHPEIPAATQPANLPAGHPPMPANMTMPGFQVPTATDGAKLTWTLPKGWTEQAGSGMRYATITSPADRKLDVAVTTFPGTVGGTLANINRWRQQVGLDPIVEANLDKTTTKVDAGGIQVIVADLDGPQQRMLAVIVPDKDQTWFLKMTGDKELVGKNKDDFVALAKSLRTNQ